MEKALVTGGAGFIGSWVVDALVGKGLEVVVVDNLSTGNRENLNDKAKFYEIDIRDNKIKEIFEMEKPDYVFHLAAQINVRESIKNPMKDAEINILGTLNVLNSCVKYGVKKFIFSSSGAVYEKDCELPTSETENKSPESPYGIAKFTIEKYLEFYKNVYGLNFVCLRYSNVYGPRQNSKGEAGVIAIFITKILSGEKPIINGSGKQTRDYVYVKDVAKANLLALNLSGIYNVGTGREISVNELFEKINKNLGMNVEPNYGSAIKGELLRNCLNASKIISKGWVAEYDLDSGLEETIDYFKKE